MSENDRLRPRCGLILRDALAALLRMKTPRTA
jgi:hypothetical protein